jgi:2-keto-3-deoxy-6-phosphogluconate aldolase
MAPLRAKVLTPDEHRRALAQAGFEAIEVTIDPPRGWICAVAQAPRA